MMIYSISKNHYNGYKTKETDSVAELLKDLATNCVSPVSIYNDSELTNAETGKTWISKQHRSNGTIVERGNMAMIDFEGNKTKLNELLRSMDAKKLFYVAIPSQSNKSDKKNARYHIMYQLSEPYSINAQAYNEQAKKFFDFIDYKWDEPDSGIDTRASFNACGYFSPTIPLKDAKSKGNKKISNPYVDFDDIAKDTYRSKYNDVYKPTKASSNALNEIFTSKQLRGKKIKEKHTKIIRTLGRGYVLSYDTDIEVRSGRFLSFEALVEELDHMSGENPRISGLGCPIENPDHTSDNTIGYAYMQYDSNGVPYICCTGNACSHRPFFTMAEGSIQVYRVDDAAGVSKYVMFEDSNIIYTHDRDMSYKLSPEALADELNYRGQGVMENGEYSRSATMNAYCVGAESIQINHNPFAKEGLDIYTRTFTISPAARFEPVEEDPNDVVTEAIRAFDDDEIICDYPISLIYLSYYLFHTKQIMAVLFLVNSDRGSGKSFWVLDLPQWYLGHSKVSAMGSSSIIAGWDDEKLGKRLVVYEDVEHLNKSELGKLKSDIKSDATAGDTKYLNIKGQGKKRSFGFNTAGTSNHYNQIPFDGRGDRRIYPSPYKKLDSSRWLASELRNGAKHMVENRTNAINYLYKIYRHCEENKCDKLQEALYYKVPISKIRDVVENSTQTDGVVAMNIIRNGGRKKKLISRLLEIVASDTEERSVERLLDNVEYTDNDEVKIPIKVLHQLWSMLPSGRNSALKAMNQRALLSIFGIDVEVKSIRIKGKVSKGVSINTIF